MLALSYEHLRFLDSILKTNENLNQLQNILVKIERCCSAVKANVNLADVIEDRKNFESLSFLFGKDSVHYGIQLILKLALENYLSKSFSIERSIEKKSQFDALAKAMSSSKEIELVISMLFPEVVIFGKEEQRKMILINPASRLHWSRLRRIPAGTLVTAFIPKDSMNDNFNKKKMHLKEVKKIFNVIQCNLKHLEEEWSLLESTQKGVQVPSFSLEVGINKTDTLIHSGNAQLIVNHIEKYSGNVAMFVLRGQREAVSIDIDSIWTKEIRNGEVVVFDFFGPKPKDDFIRDLKFKINKYTQMDKIAND